MDEFGLVCRPGPGVRWWSPCSVQVEFFKSRLSCRRGVIRAGNVSSNPHFWGFCNRDIIRYSNRFCLWEGSAEETRLDTDYRGVTPTPKFLIEFEITGKSRKRKIFRHSPDKLEAGKNVRCVRVRSRVFAVLVEDRNFKFVVTSEIPLTRVCQWQTHTQTMSM